MTSGGSGRTLRGSFARWNRRRSYWKTCRGSSRAQRSTSLPSKSWRFLVGAYGSAASVLSGSLRRPDEFSERWPRSGSMRNGRCYARTTPGRRTSGPGSSYSRGRYPTPAATSYGSSQNGTNSDRPSAGTPGLEAWARGWPSPRATDGDRGPDDCQRQGGPTLTTAAAKWGTPRAPTNNGYGAAHRADQARLEDQVARWATPTVGDSRASARGTTTTGVMHEGSSLTDMVRDRSGLLGPTTRTAGGSGSGGVVLNPAFVEALMGLPTGWTGCGCSAEGLCRYRSRWRSELARVAGWVGTERGRDG